MPPSAAYAALAEQPGSRINDTQMQRYAHRYGHAAALAHELRVLEIACRAGGGLGFLARRARQVMGLDVSGQALAQALTVAHGPLVQGDAQQLPFAAASFDLILCFEAIYDLDDPDALLHESHRVLTPEGTILLCQSNPDWLDFVPEDHTTYYPNVPELAAKLTTAGFHTIRAHGILPGTQGDTTYSRLCRRLRRHLRRVALRCGLGHRLDPLIDALKCIDQGRTTPLPARLDDSYIANWATRAKMTPLPLDRPDPTHRVIYLRATT